MGKVKNLKVLQNKLIDLSTANPLISFNAERKSFLYVVRPVPETLFKRFWTTAGYVAKVFDGEGQEALGRNEIELRNPKSPTKRVLNYILKNSRQIMNERGINVLYLAFNFVVYEDKGETCKAPLLLVPVRIKKTSDDVYSIVEYEDEAILNPALDYKLSMTEKINLPSFYKDTDYGLYVSEVRALLADAGMGLEEKVVLGMFSYEKISMYFDIAKNGAEMLKNKAVSALLGEGTFIGTLPEDASSDKGMENNVVDADSSQQRAISCAMDGYSFVLQGPPGTGKSQTITNIIAGLLYKDKKVLFVSEKMTALEVVRNKLVRAGLGDYCLELHSQKANKKEFIRAIKEVLVLDREDYTHSEGDMARSERIRTGKKLSGYSEALAKEIPQLGVTVYDLFGMFTALIDVPEVDFTISGIRSRTPESLEETLSLIERYALCCKDGGDPLCSDSPWKGLKDEVGKDDREKVTGLMGRLADTSGKLVAAGNVFREYGISFEYPSDNEEIKRFIEALKAYDGVTPAFFDGDYRREAIAALREYNNAKYEKDEIAAHTDLYFNEGVLTLDIEAMSNRLKGYSLFARIFGKDYGRDVAAMWRYARPAAEKPKYSSVLAFAEELVSRKQSEERLRRAENKLERLGLSANDAKDIDNIKKFDNLIGKCGAIDPERFRSMSARDLNRARAELIAAGENTDALLRELEAERSEEKELFHGLMPAYPGFEKINETALALSSAAADFGPYIEKRDLSLLLERTGDDGFIAAVADEEIAPELWKDCYKRCFYAQWIEAVRDDDPALRGFTAEGHNEAVRDFCRADETGLLTARNEIPRKLNSERDVVPEEERAEFDKDKADFIHESELKRGKKPIRTLLADMPEFIQKLKPCFMMSPLSVSSYLSDTDIKFDVVIFDEASQVLPEDAMCSIFRGKQVIIVGDSQQMPPSNLFAAGVDSLEDDYDDEEDETEPAAEDMGESILELSVRVMDSISLRWHYRSKSESLIAFSNANFYYGNLQTFPGVVATREDYGVEHVYVPDGVYVRRDKNNPIEAIKVVELVFEHIKKHPERSLGVVAFGLRQRDAIENMINRRRVALTDPEEIAAANEFFSESKDEPFFVKNLETVQGDERDTVIFSMGYGRDEEGKFAQRFGPLNNKGGERRLNVAVTRAKINVKLVTSVHASEIVVTDKSSEGARLLKAYIDYAENHGRASGAHPVGASVVRSVEDDVYEFLVGEGFEVERNVGASRYKIDLAIKRPGSDEYVVAVECDGKGYQRTKNTRDRDRLRKNVLIGMGWKVYRIWSAQWITNREEEKNRLLSFVTLALY